MDSQGLPGPIWVDRSSDLRQVAEQLGKYPILAVDTESNSLYVYHEQVCLIQFSTDEVDYLIDPLAISDLSSLGPIFADEKIEKVFHAAEYDLITLKRDFHFEFSNIFDTMLAARTLGRTAVGLGSMLESEFGICLDKRYQRADWGQRPLPRALLDYARLDTHYLIALRDRLQEELISVDRWDLAREDFERMRFVHSNGRSTYEWLDACWRVRGSQDLSEKQLSVLQQICQYRDSVAQEFNRPPFKVMSNEVMLQIALACPQGMLDLRQISLVNDRLAQRHGSGLLKAVQRGLNVPPTIRPSSPRPDDRFLMNLDAVRIWRKNTAQAMGVESDVILPRETVYAIAEAAPRSLDELQRVMKHLPVRWEKFGEDILRVVR